MQRIAIAALACCLLVLAAAPLPAAESVQWIWSPAFEKEAAPQGACYFRKTFTLTSPEQGEVQISADDQYELFVNGRRVGGGTNWKKFDSYDVSKYLTAGANVVAVKAANVADKSAGLVARVVIKQQGETHISYSSDNTWKTTLKEFPRWQMPKFNDGQWLAARAFGPLGSTLPWGNEVVMPDNAGRFKVLPQFQVEWLIEPKETGSLIAMAFDEFGQIIAARENGPLVLIHDRDKDGLVDTVSTFCDELKNCQGIVCVSGRVLAIGDGPQGTALYRLSDEDHDGKCDRVESLLKFTGQPGEHGPHGLTLGPDGLIYMIVGNFAHVEATIEASSPHHHYYEGDLITPRYEDAGGHAVGVKAPGGTVLRTDMAGSGVELFAGGLQNPYDLAFNAEGELFTADSDMEWDLGMPWYRPTRVLHVTPGSEFGWRSGWAKWPEYYADSLPAMVETGRGSPAGMITYNHTMFPAHYHNTLFVCDWSRGRILAVKTKAHGGTYKATSEVFLEGRPLNATDIAVGPDGWLYFCTGGRGTEGGIYRVVWDGKVPPEAKRVDEGLDGVLKHPQLSSAWARQRIALIKQQMGTTWTAQVRDAALAQARPATERVRALELMQLFGPYPAPAMLADLSHDQQPMVRAKVAFLLGVHGGENAATALNELLGDADPFVQRAACEAIARSRAEVPADRLVALLDSQDRYVVSAARRALQTLPTAKWEHEVLESPHNQVFLNGSIALLTLNASPQVPRAVLGRSAKMLKVFLNDEEFLNLLRVVQLALIHGQIQGHEITELRGQIAEEYPTKDIRMNRELVRLLAYLQSPTASEQFTNQLKSDADSLDKLHVAMHARFLTVGWTTERKLAVLKFLEDARALPGGHSFGGMLENVSRDFFGNFSEVEQERVLAEGAKWPTSALSVLAKLKETSPNTLVQIRSLDRQVKSLDTESAKRLRTGIIAVLGMSGDEESMAYLRELWQTEPDRRVAIAIGLAQDPDGENWPLLVKSLSIVEGAAAQEVMMKLSSVDRRPDDPEALRQVIIRGLMLGDAGGKAAVTLLEKWTGEEQDAVAVATDAQPTGPAAKQSGPVTQQLIAWQQWFSKTHPDAPEAKLPTDSEKNNWTFQELLAFLSGPEATHGDATRGTAIFEKAQCVKCHAFGNRGERIGPDLSTVGQRFQKKEILESILFPSHVISDQYATQTIQLTSGRVVTGLASPVGDGSIVVLDSSGQKVKIAKDEIEESQRSNISTMPEGLLNVLTIEEVNDLFAYLLKSGGSDVAKRPTAKKR